MIKNLIKFSVQRSTVFRALKISIVVTPILVMINHWEDIIMGNLSIGFVWTVIFTFFVPYSVSTFSTVSTYLEKSTDVPPNGSSHQTNTKEE